VKGRFKNLLFDLSQWIKNTPERAVESAYRAAVAIKKLEDDYFEGNSVSKDWGYATNTYSVFQTQLQSALSTIDVRLAEYRISSRIPSFLKPEVTKISINPVKLIGNPNIQNTAPNILQKLAFIDFVLSRYRFSGSISINSNVNAGNGIDNDPVKIVETVRIDAKPPKKPPKSSLIGTEVEHGMFKPKYVEQTYVPISILQSLERIRRNLTAGDTYEQDLVQEVRQTRRRINIGIRFIIILVVVTITTQQVSKNLIYKPIVEGWESKHKIEFKFSEDIQEQALNKFRLEKEKLEFQLLLNPNNNNITNTGNKIENINEVLDQNPMQKLLEEKALEVYKISQDLSLEGIQNLCADLTTGIVVYAILMAGKRELGIIKDFLDETLHGLNDNAKAFLIIVISDTFVGYHSKEGWEVLLGTIALHFGIPENRDFTLTFIAIVPVFLDALLKFWVFQTLTQSSPSTSAIYSEMNK
jgi:hypothetical protein